MIEELICHPLRPHFSDRLDGEPVPPVIEFFTRLHLAFCPQCMRTYESLKETRRALALLREPDPPGR